MNSSKIYIGINHLLEDYLLRSCILRIIISSKIILEDYLLEDYPTSKITRHRRLPTQRLYPSSGMKIYSAKVIIINKNELLLF